MCLEEYMGNLFGGGGNGDDSTMMILVVGVAMLCCSSSSVLGYGWYDNWFCDVDANLGKDCSGTGGGTSPSDSTTVSTPSTSDSTSTSTSTSESTSTGDGDTGGGDSGGGETGGGGSTKTNKCKDKVTVELAYLPVDTKYKAGSTTKAKLIKGGKTTTKTLKDAFLKDCVSQYHCKIGEDVYASEKQGTLSYVGKYPVDSGGNKLTAGVAGVNPEGIKGYASIKLGNSKKYKIKDTIGGDKCAVSIYTGKEQKGPNPNSWDGLKHGQKIKPTLS